MSKAQGQFTIIDYNDALTLTGYIGSNLAKTQMYNPDNDTYNPDWTDTNLVLTPSLYVIGTTTAGYAGNISMLIGVSNDGSVTGLQVRQMEETFGLGGKALTDWEFLAQFLGTEGDAVVGENIDAISGATVTSKAITRSVNSAVAFVTGTDVDSGATSWGG